MPPRSDNSSIQRSPTNTTLVDPPYLLPSMSIDGRVVQAPQPFSLKDGRSYLVQPDKGRLAVTANTHPPTTAVLPAGTQFQIVLPYPSGGPRWYPHEEKLQGGATKYSASQLPPPQPDSSRGTALPRQSVDPGAAERAFRAGAAARRAALERLQAAQAQASSSSSESSESSVEAGQINSDGEDKVTYGGDSE